MSPTRLSYSEARSNLLKLVNRLSTVSSCATNNIDTIKKEEQVEAATGAISEGEEAQDEFFERCLER